MSKKLSKREKAANKWWYSRFDAKNYKNITLYNHGQQVTKYTTANKRYSDDEDARAALFVVKQYGIPVDCISVDGKKYSVIGGFLGAAHS